MNAIITGMNGTVAPVLTKVLTKSGHKVIPWNRSQVPIDNLQVAKEFIRKENPDWFFHVATGSADWAEFVAQICFEQNIIFLYTSSVSVFSSHQQGPFTVDVQPQPNDDYGRYKLECEQRIRKVNQNAIIVRLGWQIGKTTGGNQMVEFLNNTYLDNGKIEASKNFYPACSFLEDTAICLVDIMQNISADLYQLDGNPGMNFYEISIGLNKLLKMSWKIDAVNSPVQNNQLLDERVQIRTIDDWIQG
jgi:dTDP-4-dehydrorhamnose reductase